MSKLDKWGPMTVLVVVVAVIVVLVGGVVVVVHPESLSFNDYVKVLLGVAGSAGLTAVGRGINLAGQKIADAHAFVTDLAADFEDDAGRAGVTESRSTHSGLKG